MGFFKDFLFGSEPEAKITDKSLLTPAQKKAEGLLASELTPQANQFEGDLSSTGPSDIEALSLEGLEELARGRAQGKTEAEKAATAKLLELISAGPQDVNEFVNQINEESRFDVTENVLPQLDRKFANRFFSSDRRNAEGDVLDNLARTLASNRSSLTLQAQRNQIGDALKAIELLPKTEGAALDELGQIQELGALPRDIEDMRLSGEFEKFIANQGFNDKRKDQLLALLGTRNKENIATVTGGSEGFLSGVGKGFATGFGSTF